MGSLLNPPRAIAPVIIKASALIGMAACFSAGRASGRGRRRVVLLVAVVVAGLLPGAALSGSQPTGAADPLVGGWSNYTSVFMTVDGTFGDVGSIALIHEDRPQAGIQEYAVLLLSPRGGALDSYTGNVLWSTGGQGAWFATGDYVNALRYDDRDEVLLNDTAAGVTMLLCGPSAPVPTPFPMSAVCGSS